MDVRSLNSGKSRLSKNKNRATEVVKRKKLDELILLVTLEFFPGSADRGDDVRDVAEYSRKQHQPKQ